MVLFGVRQQATECKRQRRLDRQSQNRKPVWVNYTRQNGGRNPVSGDPTKQTLADFGSDFGVVGTPSLSDINVTGVEGFRLGQAITGPKAGANVYGLRDVLSTTRGKHTLYIGGEAGLEKDFQLTSLSNYGAFNFSSANAGTAAARTTNALSDFVSWHSEYDGAEIPASMPMRITLAMESSGRTTGGLLPI